MAMQWLTYALYVLGALIAIRVVMALVRLIWGVESQLKIAAKSHERPHLIVSKNLIWRDPDGVEDLDLEHGPGGREGVPRPPFRFLKEHEKGSSPCVSVLDANDRTWRVKWGDEVQSETFASRLIWAAGYFAETNFFVPEGAIEDVPENLGRARECIAGDCKFENARFELDEEKTIKLFDEHGWAWNDNPFLGTHELHGLKIMIMLTSNWDNKDVRDVARGSNTAIFYYALPDGTREAHYLIIDWGASMGKWGEVMSRAKWDAEGFAAQTPQFVTRTADGSIQWGYSGQRTADAVEGISVNDIRWLCRYLGRIRDEQIRQALRAAGASPREIAAFSTALRDRIAQLQEISR
jgi:hypothetical protein